MAALDNGLKIINVASVPQRSLFRYPGGKTWLVPYIRQWLSFHGEKPRQLIEPFAGGAIVGLTVAFGGILAQGAGVMKTGSKRSRHGVTLVSRNPLQTDQRDS